MAIWQFSAGLVPRMWAEMEGDGPELLYDVEGCHDMAAAWKQNQPSRDLIPLISQVLPSTASWSDDMKIWGDQTKSDIQVCYEADTVESVRVRIDTRDDTLPLCRKVVQLARALDCCFFLPEARSIIMADATELGLAIHNSAAARFLIWPNEFLEKLTLAQAGLDAEASGDQPIGRRHEHES